MTRGNPVGVEALLAHFNPQNGSFIGIGKSSTDNLPLIGQLKYSPGERAARLSFALSATSDLHDLVGLLDALARQAGQMGALNLLAEVEENSPAFEALRRSGFAVYAWQEIYRLPFNNDSQEELPDERWNYVDGNTEWAVRSLFASLVPPIVQGAEPLPQQLGGYVYSQNGEVLAYVESVFGPQGVYLRPLIHPTMDKIPSLLLGLRLKLSPFWVVRSIWRCVLIMPGLKPHWIVWENAAWNARLYWSNI